MKKYIFVIHYLCGYTDNRYTDPNTINILLKPQNLKINFRVSAKNHLIFEIPKLISEFQSFGNSEFQEVSLAEIKMK